MCVCVCVRVYVVCYLACAAHTLLASVWDVETSRLRRIAETLAWFGV